jgi:hypothetical protein
MANSTFMIIPSDNAANVANLQVPTLAASVNVVLPATAGTLLLVGDPSLGTTRVPVNDTSYVVSGTNNQEISYTAIGAARQVTLPAPTTAGQLIIVLDESGSCSGTNTITVITAAGTIDGGSSKVLNLARATSSFRADGTSKWTSNSGLNITGNAATVTGLSVTAGKTLTATNNITIAGTDGKTLTLSHSLTLDGVDGKTLTFNNSITFSGTDATTMTFPYVTAPLRGTMWSKYTPTTLTNWTTATTILGAANTGVGTLTIPANALVVGSVIKIKLLGTYNHGSSAVAFTVSVLIGGVQIGITNGFSSGSGSVSNKCWGFDYQCTCIATGTTATIIGNGILNGYDLGDATFQTAAANVNTGNANAIDVKIACGSQSSSNNFTLTSATVEVC